ncbi:phytanoyl-CoA dioxygenase family protein [Streptomyces sp. NPDC001351]|uniref:phytanoyl-CoA dioxygenase family protein n=1 Tax=Streptomyces sp. NPDC001351 TaxID=3364564 RepID=UPI0036C9BD57
MSADLSTTHGAIRPWPQPANPQALTQEQLDSYWENGFLIGLPVFSADEIAEIRADIEEISDPEHDGRDLWFEYHSDASKTGGQVHGVGGWRVRRSLHDLIWHPTIVGAIQQILGGPGRLLFDQLFWKPPRQKGVVAWHQDFSYQTYAQPMNHVTCWIALDDADVSNGCVQYVPGSHKWGVLLQRPSKIYTDPDSFTRQLTEEQRAKFHPVPAEVPAGSVLFHHPLTIHGSLPNQSDRPRRGTTVHAVLDGTKAVIDEPTRDGIPAWLLGGAGPFYPVVDEPQGPLLDGQYFPRLG